MRTISFLKKEVLHLLHAPETVLLMLLFPALLTWVLGTAFSGMSTRTIEVPETRIPIVTDGGMISGMYIKNAGETGIRLEEISREELERRITAGSVRQYVELKGNDIVLHSDEENGLEAMVVKMYSSAFAQQANLAALALRAGRLGQMTPQYREYAAVEDVAGRNEPNSFGYYGVTMLTMIILYGSLQAMEQLSMEKKNRTGLRLQAAPYHMPRVFLVKTAAVAGMLMLQALLLVLLNRYVYGVEYRSVPMVILMILPAALFATALGVLAYQLLRSASAASVLLNILIIAFVFMGRGYIMVSMENDFFAKLARFSPVGWVNQGLFEYIYQGSAGYIIKAGLWLTALSAAMYLAAFILFKREEGSDRVAAY